MIETEGTGIFIYGDKPEDAIRVTWHLTSGKKLSNEKSWRAEITSERTKLVERAGLDLLKALRQDFVFKLKIDDGSTFPCGIWDMDLFSDAYPTVLYFEACSRDQEMVEFSMEYPNQT